VFGEYQVSPEIVFVIAAAVVVASTDPELEKVAVTLEL